jgi:molybdate transport system ATP-binding protein
MDAKTIQVRISQTKTIPLNIDLSCDAGEILVVVGPSGSGKTTLLRSIAGLYRPDTGRIQAGNTVWYDNQKEICLPVQQRNVGMVFQNYALFPHLTAENNIKVALGQLPDNASQKRIDQLLEMVNMSGLAKRLPHELSGGQQQRIALARALARQPEVLLLDEPFSAVDQQTRRKLVRELIQLHKQINIPIIHVTHDLNEARRIASRICIIHNGKSLQTDIPEKIMTKPVNAEVAYQTGHMNIFTGKVLEHDYTQQVSYLQWGDYKLETAFHPELVEGSEIDWLIPAENLILHRRERPSKGEKENPVSGVIKELYPLGENASVTIAVKGNDSQLHLAIPMHAAKRNNLDEGENITVSLLSEGIHPMYKS